LGHHVQWSAPRKGKQVATFSIYVDEKYNGKTYTNRRVMQITKRSIDKEGQQLLLPKLEIEGWWTTLDYSDQEILALYRDHATSEQFHSEFKTDLDLERLPSQSFDGNDLVLSMGVMVYNILRWIGLAGLMEEDSPVRHTAKRRRIRTVLQEMIYVGAQLYEKSRFLILRFGKSTPAFSPFQRVYQQLAYG
jgi:predicted metal-dependent hydrolase